VTVGSSPGKAVVDVHLQGAQIKHALSWGNHSDVPMSQYHVGVEMVGLREGEGRAYTRKQLTGLGSVEERT